MGNQLAGAEKMKNVSAKIHADLVEQFDETLDERGYDSRSEAIRDHMLEVVESYDTHTSAEYYPDLDRHRKIYETCLTLANKKLILSLRRYESTLAEKLGVKKQSLMAVLRPLEERGYVRRQVGGAMLGSGDVHVSYRVKPPEADPDQWKYRLREKTASG